MPMLTNPKHERVAQLVAAGAAGSRAYGDVYGADPAANGTVVSASRLLRRANVSARVTELRSAVDAAVTQQLAAGQQATILTLSRKRQILNEIAEGREPARRMETPMGETRVYDPVKAIELDAKLSGELGGEQRSVWMPIQINFG